MALTTLLSVEVVDVLLRTTKEERMIWKSPPFPGCLLVVVVVVVEAAVVAAGIPTLLSGPTTLAAAADQEAAFVMNEAAVEEEEAVFEALDWRYQPNFLSCLDPSSSRLLSCWILLLRPPLEDEVAAVEAWLQLRLSLTTRRRKRQYPHQ